jgi:hypothetical protein
MQESKCIGYVWRIDSDHSAKLSRNKRARTKNKIVVQKIETIAVLYYFYSLLKNLKGRFHSVG